MSVEYIVQVGFVDGDEVYHDDEIEAVVSSRDKAFDEYEKLDLAQLRWEYDEWDPFALADEPCVWKSIGIIFDGNVNESVIAYTQYDDEEEMSLAEIERLLDEQEALMR